MNRVRALGPRLRTAWDSRDGFERFITIGSLIAALVFLASVYGIVRVEAAPDIAYLGAAVPDSLMEPMNRFAKAYNAFAQQLQGGVYDQAKAKELSKLWRAVENCGDWPLETPVRRHR